MENLIKIAKEKGYTGSDSLEEVRTWIRVKYFMHAVLFFSLFTKKWAVDNYFINLKKSKRIAWKYKDLAFDDYDDALALAIEHLLKTI